MRLLKITLFHEVSWPCRGQISTSSVELTIGGPIIRTEIGKPSAHVRNASNDRGKIPVAVSVAFSWVKRKDETRGESMPRQ